MGWLDSIEIGHDLQICPDCDSFVYFNSIYDCVATGAGGLGILEVFNCIFRSERFIYSCVSYMCGS